MRDTVDPDFASYVDARQGRWLRTAYLVYGDLERAEEALLRAFTRLSLRWTKVDDPDAFVQRLLYQPALARWNRVKAFPDEDDPVKLALAELTPGAAHSVRAAAPRGAHRVRGGRPARACRTPTVHGHGLTAFSRFRTALGRGGLA